MGGHRRVGAHHHGRADGQGQRGGRRVAKPRIRFLERRPGRTAGEERVAIALGEGPPVAHGLWFTARPGSGLRAWADLVVSDLDAIPEIASALDPGSSLMVAYEGDETERALRRRVPPAATPLGLAMLRAGCRWFKDWYYPEGGREGGTKLQGTLPLDVERKARAEQGLGRELQAFLERPGLRDIDSHRAQEALALLQSQGMGDSGATAPS